MSKSYNCEKLGLPNEPEEHRSRGLRILARIIARSLLASQSCLSKEENKTKSRDSESENIGDKCKIQYKKNR